ncbi:MAG: hypothetical protein ACRD38_02875 [Nitrososphaerales archaeon]
MESAKNRNNLRGIFAFSLIAILLSSAVTIPAAFSNHADPFEVHLEGASDIGGVSVVINLEGTTHVTPNDDDTTTTTTTETTATDTTTVTETTATDTTTVTETTATDTTTVTETTATDTTTTTMIASVEQNNDNDNDDDEDERVVHLRITGGNVIIGTDTYDIIRGKGVLKNNGGILELKELQAWIKSDGYYGKLKLDSAMVSSDGTWSNVEGKLKVKEKETREEISFTFTASGNSAGVFH